MKTIYCPACGQRCAATTWLNEDTIFAVCAANHRWTVLLNFDADTPDKTSIISFQCDGTSAYDLPESGDNDDPR